MNKNLLFVVKNWLQSLNYNLRDFEIWFSSHPDFPSLKSITDTINYFNIESITAEVDQQTLLSFTKPFLTLVNLDGYQQIVSADLYKTKDRIEIICGKNKTKTLSVNDFFDIWERIVIVVDENNKNGDSLNGWFKRYSNRLILAMLTICFIFYIFIVKQNFLYTVGFFISVLGVFTSIIILRKDYNISTEFTDKFCTALPNSNCENVMNSKGSKFYGVSLSEISIVYFIGITLFQLMSPEYYILSVLSLATIPMILFSIYYQWKIVKTWCPLCLGIVLCLFLWSVIGASIILTYPKVIVTTTGIFTLLISFGLVAYILFSLKPNLKRIGSYNDIKKELISFKRNYHLYMPFYVNSSKQIHDLKLDDEIILGNRINPLIVLTVVTNPLCESCIETHKTYEDILKSNPSVQLKLRFLVPFYDRKDPRVFISEQILNINQNQPDKTMECLSEWYKLPDIKKWVEKWGINYDFVHNQTLKIHNNWCIENNVDYTPALLVNDKVFPRVYDTSDIKYFIDYILKYEQYSKVKR